MISIGTKAPEVLGVDAEGNEIKLSDYQGLSQKYRVTKSAVK